jgi:hypothetical protein
VTAFPILQFGTSRFLQAHADLFASEAGLIELVNVNGLGVKQPRLTAALGGAKAGYRGESG